MDQNGIALADSNFRIISSLRWTTCHVSSCGSDISSQASEADLELLPLHRDRMLASAEKLCWPDAVEVLKTSGLSLIRSMIDLHFAQNHSKVCDNVQIYKVRITLSQTGELAVDSSSISQLPSELFSQQSFIPASLTIAETDQEFAVVHVDLEPTIPSSFTTHKTTYRTPYDSARRRSNISDTVPTKAEVLLWNTDGEVMEASLCTPYFLRDGEWSTPALSSGGNAGVSRRKGLEKGLCQEGIILVSSVRNEEAIWLSNAVRGFFRGRIRF